ncbi:MAG TPA: cytochrome c-type biogenesis CcmF C-terminal domain-containing protein, partial [Candidatus Limnocylindria bacterium]|nr:cytochrome c-type biogenesis CcmF C-terminal domain-containing protein [Candidatus Limnocylindria bacterium]
AWRRVTAANLRRNFTLPVAAGVATAAVLIAYGDAAKPFALAMFALGAFVLTTVAQELWRGAWARRALTNEPPPLALVGLIRRNRRRYGGYIVHAGIAVLLIGVAASSSFQHSRDVVLTPGQAARVNGYTITYVRPTVSATPAKLSFGAVLNVTRGGKHVVTLRTSRGFYPSQDPTLGVIGRFFNGEADSNVGLQAGLTRDIWTVVNPDLTPLQNDIDKGDRLFASELPLAMERVQGLPANQAQADLAPLWALRDRAILNIADRFATHPWPVDFLLIVDPMVLWIWIGALIVASGGLIALWPIPALLRGPARVRARRAAVAPDGAARVPAPSASVTAASPMREPV